MQFFCINNIVTQYLSTLSFLFQGDYIITTKMSSLKINPLKDWKSISYMQKEKSKRLKNFHGISLDLMNFSGKQFIEIVEEDFEEEWTELINTTIELFEPEKKENLLFSF